MILNSRADSTLKNADKPSDEMLGLCCTTYLMIQFSRYQNGTRLMGINSIFLFKKNSSIVQTCYHHSPPPVLNNSRTPATNTHQYFWNMVFSGSGTAIFPSALKTTGLSLLAKPSSSNHILVKNIPIQTRLHPFNRLHHLDTGSKIPRPSRTNLRALTSNPKHGSLCV